MRCQAALFAFANRPPELRLVWIWSPMQDNTGDVSSISKGRTGRENWCKKQRPEVRNLCHYQAASQAMWQTVWSVQWSSGLLQPGQMSMEAYMVESLALRLFVAGDQHQFLHQGRKHCEFCLYFCICKRTQIVGGAIMTSSTEEGW